MRKFIVTVFISWKKVCVDPQNLVILHALQGLNPNIVELGISKRFNLTIMAEDEAGARLAAEDVSNKLLANFNTEEFEIAGVKEVVQLQAA